MNWFKKQINKLFDNDIDDEEYYEEEYYEEQIPSANKTIASQMEDDVHTKRKSFKFPLIADEEMELPIESQDFNSETQLHVSSRFEEVRRDTMNFYQPNAISKVYDVEVSGIRDLLEKRQRIKGHSTVINRQESTKIRRVEKVKKQEPIKKEFKNISTPIQKNLVEEEDPLVPKRRFVPTQVPSPVYGFKKPSNIDQLLSKKQGKAESKSIENDLEENKMNADSSQTHYENKVEPPHSDSLNEKEKILSSSELLEKIENQKGNAYPELNQQAPIPSYIEIEDEVEELPIVLKEEIYEKVEEIPMLAESVEHMEIEEVKVVQNSEVQAKLPPQAHQETAVTVYEADPIEHLEAVDEHELFEAEIEEPIEEPDELQFINHQNEQKLEENFGLEQFIETDQIVEVFEGQEEPREQVQVDKIITNLISHAEASEHHQDQENMLESIQSAQVQKLVSIALSDSELEEGTGTDVAAGPVLEQVQQPKNSQVEELETDQDQWGLPTGPTGSLDNIEAYRDTYQGIETSDLEVDEIEKPMFENEENTTEEPQSKDRILPFNVLMLKSDKEKYAAKLAQKQMLQHNDDNKEMHRHTSKTGELHEIEQLPVNSQAEPIMPTLDIVEEKQVSQTKIVKEDEDLKDEKLLIQNRETVSLQEEIEETSKENPTNSPEVKSPPKIYVKPSLDFLSPPEEKTEDREWLESQGDVLVESLSYFQVTAQVESITQGPAVTQFEITVGHGTKVSKIRNLSDDLKLALAAKDIRIQAPIPGKSTIGIEIPNRISRAVQLSEVTCSDSFKDSDSPLEAALGLDLTGKPITIDLRKMPHGLIAGATGSGKSVCINSILISLLYKANPNELKLMLIDPKMVELAPFNHIPHLVSPVITDVKAATAALKWAVEEMERRYQLFAHAGVRDLPRFNKLAESKGEYGHKLPYILIVIDELADLMMMSPADVEEAICRIAQKARACGIHLIVATQRPSVDVITGLIKSNIPTRIAFAVSSQVDSRTILDAQGAERLLGRGDMLYLGNGMSDPIRLQGTFVTDEEIEEIIEHVRSQGEPDYFFQQDELLKKTEMVEEQDELFEEVCRFVFEQGTASTSSIQRKYHIGYNRAARLIDMLESQGYISEQRGSKPREVYITDSDLTTMFE